MKKKLLVIIIIFLSVALIYQQVLLSRTKHEKILPTIKNNLVVRDSSVNLNEFNFDNLMDRDYLPSSLNVLRVIKDTDVYTSYLVKYTSDKKDVSALLNIPKGKEKAPVILMLRGYVPIDSYITGVGTNHAGQVLAEHGYITIAPDFPGYGESDMPENNVWWERFNKPVQVLNLLKTIKVWNINNNTEDIINIRPIENKIGIWAHSNGGQIALSVLEITKENYPTTLWAPVTKSFPYSILCYTDEYDDQGKALRKKLSELEDNYEVEKYSINNYLENINAPIQLHQGLSDDAVPEEWSLEFTLKLKALGKDIKYYTYPNADHNMKGSWDNVIQKDIEFFNEEFGLE